MCLHMSVHTHVCVSVQGRRVGEGGEGVCVPHVCREGVGTIIS